MIYQINDIVYETIRALSVSIKQRIQRSEKNKFVNKSLLISVLFFFSMLFRPSPNIPFLQSF